ncbi:MAG: hypothetical protein HUJ90_06250 [Bacteroidales bacterium]|nr:hypothetical protein [Bacteroidales bacterium]
MAKIYFDEMTNLDDIPYLLYIAAMDGHPEAMECMVATAKDEVDIAQANLDEAKASSDEKAVRKAERKLAKQWSEVMRWLRKLGKIGYVEYMYELAQLYDGDCPYKASAKLALSWYKKAAQGHEAAAERLQELLGNS